MADLVTGTVTFLFTDVEGSTRLWEQHPEAMRHAMDRRLGLLRHAVSTHAGQVFRTVGDGLCAALAAALQAQAALVAEPGGVVGPPQSGQALGTAAARAEGQALTVDEAFDLAVSVASGEPADSGL